MTRRTSLFRRLSSARGQGMVEMAMSLPILVVVVLGVVEVSYGLLDQHVVTKLTREGSNMISRDATLQDATTALVNMATPPVDFNSASTVIFSVVKHVATTGATNYDQMVLYQRRQYGALAATSTITTIGSGSFGGAPDYVANNSDSDTNLRVTNLSKSMVGLGGLLYITEVFTRHQLLTPFDKFGIQVPTTLSSIAYF